LIPASLFVMIESSCKAQVTSPPQDYPNGSGHISTVKRASSDRPIAGEKPTFGE
jgi:hypothetical protein